jgi:AcrR family transcriptional regulator
LTITKNDWKANPQRPAYDEAREKIIEAAIRIISERGWKKLRFDLIAKEVGCARPTLYRYFSSKEELLSAVLIHLMYQLSSEIHETIAENHNPKDALVEATYLGASYLRNEYRFNMVLDPSNIKYLTQAAISSIPAEMTPMMSNYMIGENGESLLREGVTIDEASKWLILQIISLAQFGPIGKTPEEEKGFIRKMLIPALYLK